MNESKRGQGDISVERDLQKLFDRVGSLEKNADEQHAEVMEALKGINTEVKRINGNVANNDRRLIVIEAVESERLRSIALGRGAPVPGSGFEAVKQVGYSAAGGGGGAFLALLFAGKLMGWW